MYVSSLSAGTQRCWQIVDGCEGEGGGDGGGVGWGGVVLKSVSLLPVPLQIAETRIFFSKKGRKTCSLCGTGGFFFSFFFSQLFCSLMPCGRVTLEADSDTAEQQSLNIRAAGTV